MNLILHLPAETEAKLLDRARASGKDVEALALEALSEKLADDDRSPTLPRDAWHARLDAMLASMPRGNPDADFSRETIYDDPE
jgi:hypothetical protein